MNEKVEITLTDEEMIDYVRCDSEPETLKELQMFLKMANSYIPNLLKHPYSYYVNEYGELPEEFRLATFMLIAHWYENRSIIADRYSKGLTIPHAVDSIIQMHRG